MDGKLMATSFVTIFIAEIGDKTQLATLLISSKSGKPWEVFLAAAAGLVTAAALGAAAGGWISQRLGEDLLRWISGGLFLAIGLWTLLSPHLGHRA